ncbi:HNH endonuclease [Halorubrum sp. SP3]|nr:HNH endonuclease [Halorubrum sp. SP3]
MGEDNPMFGQTGEEHHNWRGGYGQNYGEGWLDARRRTLERDKYECQDCGMDRQSHKETFGYDLEVHHIQPFRTFSDAATANQLSNLITLCTTCHQKRENRTE